ncbi:sensor histidine kinase [Streptomyces sp. NPDC002287]
MVREDSPGSPSPAPSVAWVLPALATAVISAAAAALVPASARASVIWIGVAACAAVALSCAEAARRGRALAEARATAARRLEALALQQTETVWLAEVLLPDIVRRLRKGEFPEDLLSSLEEDEVHQPALSPEFRAAHQAVLRSVLDAVVAEEDLRDSAQRAFVNIARRVQAIVHQQAQELREMEDRHGRNPAVFGDLLRLDHGTALIGRLADSIAVLGGARPGRQWSKSIPLYSVLRGAMSRIIDYQRVELHSVTQVAVIGPAVEPLIHALAELLDNATRYSPPQTKVHLTAVEVNSGIAIEIEDGGLSMSEEARKRAERMLRQAQEGIDLTDLGETPRLGLAVVGRLARAYNLRVSLRSSAYGGVRAVLIVPQELITTVTSASGLAHGIGASSGPRPALPSDLGLEPPGLPPQQQRRFTGPQALPQEDDEDWPVVTERTANGLPQRRRRARVAAPAEPATVEQSTTAAPERAEAQPGIWLAAFQSGLSGNPEPAEGAEGHSGGNQNTNTAPAPASEGEQP